MPIDAEKRVIKIGGNLWSGPDIHTLDQTILGPYESQRVPVHSPNIAPALAVIDGYTGIHSSSRLIQNAIEIPIEEARHLTTALAANGNHPTVEFDLELKNSSPGRVEIPKNVAVGTAYVWNENAITGDSLVRVINNNNGGIKIDGQEGRDWSYHIDETGTITGIDFSINQDPQNMRWRPPDDKTITIGTKKGENFRESIDATLTSFAQQQPHPDEKVLWVGETISHIKLPHTIHAFIPQDAYPKGTNGTRRGNREQRNSPLLTGGRTNWPVRFEIFSRTDDKTRPNTILITFAEAAKLKRV